MLKRHCDLCDSVIKSYQTHYSLVETTHEHFTTTEETELEICKGCLDEIIKRKNEKCEVNNDY